MRPLAKFFHLPPHERSLYLRAAFLLLAFRAGLWLVRFEALQKISGAPGPRRVGQGSAPSPSLIARAVSGASRYLPGTGGCLTKALAAQSLLRRFGHPASLQLGVSRGGTHTFRAHAWVESGGEVLVGGPVDDFVPLRPTR